MRPRNLVMRNENESFNQSSPNMKQKLASPSSGGFRRDSFTKASHSGTASSSKFDAAILNSTPFLAPSPTIRQKLTYSPSKGNKMWSQRITFFLFGLIVVSVFLTMMFTIRFMDTNGDSEGGLTFGTPQQTKLKVITEEHPGIRGTHDASVTEPRLVDEPDKPDASKDKNASYVNTAGMHKVSSARSRPDEAPDNIDVDASNDLNVDVNGLVEDGLEEMPNKHPEQRQREEPRSSKRVKNELEDEVGHIDEPEQNESQEHVISSELNHQNEIVRLIKPGLYPRVAFYEAHDPPPIRTFRELPDDPMLHAPPGFEAAPQDRMKPDYTQGDCVPMHDWQTKSFPNCNLLHEYDMKAAGPGIYKGNNTNLVLEDTMILLGQGWFRHTWRLNAGSSDESVVLKTLRLEREFYDEYYDLHRRDAVAMERLTHSPFIMDIYGYCGQSAINELADFGDGQLASLEKVDRKMRGHYDHNSFVLRLQLGASVAVGVAHIHEIDNPHTPSMVHYDINPRNVAIVGAGKPKLNDFNIAEFLHWNPKTNETCGFPSRLHEPWWRAPEEMPLDPDNNMNLTAAVDVYALGSVLYHVLTTHSPRGKMKKVRAEEVRAQVMRGEPPPLNDGYMKSDEPAIVAFREALKLCFEPDPRKRGTARQVADILMTTLLEIKRGRKAKATKKKKVHIF